MPAGSFSDQGGTDDPGGLAASSSGLLVIGHTKRILYIDQRARELLKDLSDAAPKAGADRNPLSALDPLCDEIFASVRRYAQPVRFAVSRTHHARGRRIFIYALGIGCSHEHPRVIAVLRAAGA